MSEEVNYYAITLDNLPEYRDELHEAFKKRAGKSQKINSDAIMDMLNDVSVILAFDCESAKYFFSQSNRAIPDDYDLDALRFDEFIELLELWLQTEAEAFEGRAYGNPQDYEDIEMSNEQQPGFVKGKPVTRLPRNYDGNRRLLDEMMSKHKAEYQDVFRERLIEEDQTEIAAPDIFIFLQECFYLDEIEARASAEATDDFFRSIGSYKVMFQLMERYLQEGHLGNKGPDMYETTLKFDECFEFVDYWLRSDENLIFVDNRKDPNEGAVRKALMETIANYEKIIENTPNEEERELLGETVNVLKQKLYDLENGRSSVNNEARNAQISEEKRLRALREIFDFYCTQQINTGKFATFEKVKRLANTINLGTFKVFLKSFKLKMNHLRLLELYKKAAGIDENLDYEEFLDLLNKVALRAEIAEDPKVHQPQPEIMKNYKPDSYRYDPSYRQFKQNDKKKRQEVDVVKKVKKSFGRDDKKRQEEKLQEIWEHMGLYNGNYRNFIGYINLPFNSQDNENFRIPADSLKYRFRARAMQGKSPVEVKEEVQKRNYMRSLIKDLKNAEKGFMANLRVSSLPTRSEDSSSFARRLKQEDTYMKRQYTKAQMHLPQIKKLTMKRLGNSQEEDLKHAYDRFNPHDLIDDNDEDDDMYLAEYNIAKEKKRAMQDREHNNRRKIEQYGKLKKAAKGFAVNGKYGLGMRSSEPQISIQDMERESAPARYNYSVSNHSISDSRIYPVYASAVTSPKNHYNPQSVRNLKGPISHPTYLDNDMTPRYNNNSMRYSGESSIYSSPYQNYSDHNNGYYRGRDPVISNSGSGYMVPRNNGYYNSTLDRANQIEMDSYRRENQLMNNAMNIHNNQVNRGLKSLRKY